MSQPRTQPKRISLSILIGLSLIVIVAAGYDAFALGRLPIDYPPPGQFVAVNGAQLHYICQGQGEPTLMLIAGFGGGALDWSLVMPTLANQHRVCAFDRLGQDWSEASPTSRTLATIADELASAAQQLGIERPVVVGHSLGGAIVQVYAAQHPVAGLIVIEGLTIDVAGPVVARLGSYQSLDLFAQLGLLRPIGALIVHPAYPEATRSVMLALRSNSRALQRLADEGTLAANSAVTDLRAAEPRLTAPLLVIAAAKSDVPGLPAGEFVRALQALTARHPRSTFVLIPEASHYVMADHPHEVVNAIEAWLAADSAAK